MQVSGKRKAEDTAYVVHLAEKLKRTKNKEQKKGEELKETVFWKSKSTALNGSDELMCSFLLGIDEPGPLVKKGVKYQVTVRTNEEDASTAATFGFTPPTLFPSSEEYTARGTTKVGGAPGCKWDVRCDNYDKTMAQVRHLRLVFPKTKRAKTE